MNKKKWIKLGLTVLLAFSLTACGTKDSGNADQSNSAVTMTAEAENAQEALSMYKKLMDQENEILSENTDLWEKVYMEADKGSAMLENGKNYGDFLLDTIENVKDQFSDEEYELLKTSAEKISEIENKDRLLYTGMIDEYYHYRLGTLEYRSLRFETEELPEEDNYQGNAVVNYTEREVPYTRIIEHKHFEFQTGEGTVITREYPATWKKGDEPYYPINDEKNGALYAQYAELAKKEANVLFGGRLGQYKYYDMDKVIRSALDMVKEELAR